MADTAAESAEEGAPTVDLGLSTEDATVRNERGIYGRASMEWMSCFSWGLRRLRLRCGFSTCELHCEPGSRWERDRSRRG